MNPAPDPEQLVENARQQLEKGQAAQALASAQQARRLDPNGYKPPYYIAYALMEMGELDRALEAQQQSLSLATGDAARRIVQQLGSMLEARKNIREADLAARDGLHAKAARLYAGAFDAGAPVPDAALKAADLYEKRLNDLASAARLLRAVERRHPGAPEAQKAKAELDRLQGPLTALVRARTEAALDLPMAERGSALGAALEVGPGSRFVQWAVARHAAEAGNWRELENWLKHFQRIGLLEDAVQNSRVPIDAFEKDERLRTFLLDAWGAEKMAKVLASRGVRDCPACPPLVEVPAGSFLMGSPENEAERRTDEGPQRRVQIAAFLIGRTEVTQAQWRAVMGSNPSGRKGCPECPVENVSWQDVQEFLEKLSAQTGRRYRLPSEAEWEYAARAGTTTPFHTGATLSTDAANFNGRDHVYNNSAKGTYRGLTWPVGDLPANRFGLHDMHGNVYEWVADCWGSYNAAPTDGAPVQPSSCERRVLRGGGFTSPPASNRSAKRFSNEPTARANNVGFRIAAQPR